MEANNQVELDLNDIIKARHEKLARLVEMDKNPYEIVKFDKDTNALDIKNNYDNFDGKQVTLAGRMISRRIMGKASFANLLDGTGSIQLYISKNDIGEDDYAEFNQYMGYQRPTKWMMKYFCLFERGYRFYIKYIRK